MAEKKKVLITGSNGLLGQSLVRRFARNFDVYGCDLSSENFNTEKSLIHYDQLDLTQRESVQNYFAQNKADIIINSAAFTDVDLSEEKRDQCWAVNVRSVELLLEAANSYSPVFVQISTDYVFNGNKGQYRETDETNPVSYYGHTKLAAEKIVRSSNLNYIIARSMVLYGFGKKIRNNFLTWVIKELNKKNKIRVVNDQRGNPTYVDDLSEAIHRLIVKREYGLFHITGNEICSRIEFAKKIAKTFGLDASLIQEIATSELNQKAPRPMNSTFNLDRLSNVLDWLPGNLDQSLKSLKAHQVQENE